MTKRTIKGIIAMLMLLTVCLYFVSGTYARYASSVSGTAMVAAAKWAVAFKDGENNELANNFDLDFTVTANENVVSNKIAPQTTATAEIQVDLTGTEVAVDYVATVDETALAEYFGASKDDVKVTTSAKVNGVEDKTGTIKLVNDSAFTAENGKVTVTITLTWTNNDNHNTSDTAVGVAASTLSFPVTLELQQHIDTQA